MPRKKKKDPHCRYMQIRLTEEEYEAIQRKFQNSVLRSRRDYLDRANMKVTSKALNVAAKYGIKPENLETEAMAAFIKKGKLVEQLNRVDTQLDDLIAQVKVLKKYRRLSAVAAELKNLSGRQAKHFRTEHHSDILHRTCTQLRDYRLRCRST